MIREATRDDAPRIVELSVEEAKEQGWDVDSGNEIDKFSIDALARFHIRHKDAVIFVNEEDGVVNGFIAGALLPFMLDIRKHVAHEKMSGGKNKEELFNRFEKWGKEQEAPATVTGCYNKAEGMRLRRIE